MNGRGEAVGSRPSPDLTVGSTAAGQMSSRGASTVRSITICRFVVVRTFTRGDGVSFCRALGMNSEDGHPDGRSASSRAGPRSLIIIATPSSRAASSRQGRNRAATPCETTPAFSKHLEALRDRGLAQIERFTEASVTHEVLPSASRRRFRATGGDRRARRGLCVRESVVTVTVTDQLYKLNGHIRGSGGHVNVGRLGGAHAFISCACRRS